MNPSDDMFSMPMAAEVRLRQVVVDIAMVLAGPLRGPRRRAVWSVRLAGPRFSDET